MELAVTSHSTCIFRMLESTKCSQNWALDACLERLKLMIAVSEGLAMDQYGHGHIARSCPRKGGRGVSYCKVEWSGQTVTLHITPQCGMGMTGVRRKSSSVLNLHGVEIKRLIGCGEVENKNKLPVL
jgi:hypothetical protein